MLNLHNVGVDSQSHTPKSINDHIQIRGSIMNTWLTIAIIVVILWAVGFFALPGVGSLIHILLVIAVVLLLVWLFTGKKLWK